MTNAERIAKGALELARRVRSMTRRWERHPTEEATHEVRVAVRRLRTALALLPKDARERRRNRRFARRAHALFRRLAVIRDLDVVAHHFEAVGASDDVFQSLARERQKSVENARPRAMKLLAAKKPRVATRDIDETDLALRASTLVREAGATLRQLLPIVVADAERTEIVHEARKAGRALRYVYELFAPEGDARRLAWATSLQALLGELHDRDVACMRLMASSERTPETTRALLQQSADRAARHEELATFVRRTPELLDVIAPIA